ncbi:MAG: hypothetical protein LLF76_08090 [Planctomycetaceae bacterium]|nr:hypothetical protein [Planctomycetaceae bacterium]
MAIEPWSVVLTVLSIAGGMVSGLAMWNLTGLKETINKLAAKQDDQDRRIEELRTERATCKIECERNRVSKEDWVRGEGYTRRALEQLTAAFNRLEGKLEGKPDIAEQLPMIIAEAIRAAAREFKENR